MPRSFHDIASGIHDRIGGLSQGVGGAAPVGRATQAEGDGRARPAVFGGTSREVPRSMRGGTVAAKAKDIEKKILGVPARFMRPRIVLVVAVALLCAFGLVMIYSASSVTALASADADYDAAFYLKRQALFLVAGSLLAAGLAKFDYRWAKDKLLHPLIGVTLVLLLLVQIPGISGNAKGATRWISLPGFQLQPSEFAKLFIVVIAAVLIERWFSNRADKTELAKLAALGVGVPLALILIQPDKGTTVIIAATIIVMLVVVGLDWRIVAGMLVVGGLFVLALSMTQGYALSRIQSFLDPWADELGESYQLVQGFYAFGSGGLLGVGIGASKQKYSYLPEAHTDFIFAVVGEECGLIGTIGVIAGFVAVVWAGFQIARYAPDLTGRLIACGCSSLLLIQMLVNVGGVLGMIPLTGKPLPFLTYGGSSIIASLLLVGAILSVSVHSSLPETEHDRARRGMYVREGDGYDPGLSYVGEAMPRSARGSGYTARPQQSQPGASRGFTVVDGGSQGRAARTSPRGGYDRSGRGGRADAGRYPHGRVDLGSDPSERLRNRRR